MLAQQELAEASCWCLGLFPRRWSLDRITHLLKTEKGQTAIFVLVDKFTKMCHLAPCKDTDDAEASTMLFKDNCFGFHGWPGKVISDRGPDGACCM